MKGNPACAPQTIAFVRPGRSAPNPVYQSACHNDAHQIKKAISQKDRILAIGSTRSVRTCCNSPNILIGSCLPLPPNGLAHLTPVSGAEVALASSVTDASGGTCSDLICGDYPASGRACFGSYTPIAPPPGSVMSTNCPHRSSCTCVTDTPFLLINAWKLLILSTIK